MITHRIFKQMAEAKAITIAEPLNEGPVLTIPGQSMPIDEMLNRYARGQGIPYQTSYTFDSELFTQGLPDLTKMDRLDVEDFVRALEDKAVAAKERLKKVEEEERLRKVADARDQQEAIQAYLDAKKEKQEAAAKEKEVKNTVS